MVAKTYIYDPATNSWSTGPTKLYNDRSDEETWTKLADGSILSYDILGNPQHAQRMDPTTMTWVDAGSVPVALRTAARKSARPFCFPTAAYSRSAPPATRRSTRRRRLPAAREPGRPVRSFPAD